MCGIGPRQGQRRSRRVSWVETPGETPNLVLGEGRSIKVSWRLSLGCCQFWTTSDFQLQIESVFLAFYDNMFFFFFFNIPFTFWNDFSYIPVTIQLANFNLFIFSSYSVVPLRCEAFSVTTVTVTHPMILIHDSCRIPTYTSEAECSEKPRLGTERGLYLPSITCHGSR